MDTEPESRKDGFAERHKADDPESRGRAKPEIRKSASPAFRESGRPVEQFLGPGLQVETGILMRLAPRHRGDALDEIEDAFRLAAFFGQHRLDDLGRFSLGETALAQEIVTVFVTAGDDLFPCRLDTVDEGHRRRVGEPGQGRGGFVGEARGSIFGMADGDLLEILDAVG